MKIEINATLKLSRGRRKTIRVLGRLMCLADEIAGTRRRTVRIAAIQTKPFIAFTTFSGFYFKLLIFSMWVYVVS